MTLDPIRQGGWSRRELLRAVVAGGVTSAFLPRAARSSGTGTGPQGLFLIYHPNGLEPGWEPVGTRTSFTLPPVLAGLARHQDRLSITSVRSGIQNEIFGHYQGMVTMWTGGTIPGNEGFSQHPSIDQIIADRIAVGTPLRSLELGVQATRGDGLTNDTVMIYGGPNAPLPPDSDPTSVFQRLFGDTTGGVTTTQIRAERRSVLDFVGERMAKVRDVYGVEGRARIDAHLEAVRNVEQRIDGLEALSCDVASPDLSATRYQLLYDDTLFETLADLQTDLAVAALSCGVTRVASLQLSVSSSPTVLPGLLLPGVHTVMHSGTGDEKIRINRWFVDQLARVLDRFEAEPGGGDGTLLDDVMVVWGTEMAMGNHNNEPVPFILAGGGAFPGGRWTTFDERPRHTRLLVSILRAFGIVEIDRLGDFDDRGALDVLWR